MKTKRENKDPNLSRESFSMKYLIGTGACGEVWKAMPHNRKKFYALKILNKNLVLNKGTQD